VTIATEMMGEYRRLTPELACELMAAAKANNDR